MTEKPENPVDEMEDREDFEDVVIGVSKAVQQYIDYMWSDEYSEDRTHDYANAIFEAAVEAIMGEEIAEKLQKRYDELDDR